VISVDPLLTATQPSEAARIVADCQYTLWPDVKAAKPRYHPIPPDRTINLVGQRFGRLIVVERAGTKNKSANWMCLCDCGNMRAYTSSKLRSGQAKTCGCGRRGPRKRRRPPFEYPVDIVQLVRDSITAGRTLHEVAALLNRSRATVIRVMRLNGIAAAARGPRPRAAKPRCQSEENQSLQQPRLLYLPGARISGVYAIVNRKTGVQYIGSSVDIDDRLRDHAIALERGTHQNIYLQRAWRKYGADAFEFTVIEAVADHTMLSRVEQVYMDRFPRRAKYNMASSADRPPSRKGAKMPQSACDKLSERSRLIPRTAEWRAHMSASLRGRKLSMEQRKQIGDRQRGRPSKRGKGWHHTAETKQKISDTKRRKRFAANENQ